MAKGKTNWGKIAIWTAIIGGASVGLYFGIKKIIDAGKEDETATPPPAGGAENTEVVSCTVVFPLMKGSGYGTRACENAHVQVIQKYLNKLFPSKPMNVDGEWGGTTQKYIEAALGISSVSESQYNLIKAGKSIKGTGESASSPNKVTINGTTYNVVENAPIAAERVIAAELLRQLGKAVTEANIKSYTDAFSFGYMVMRWYYAKNGYGVFIYNNESYSVSTGKKIVL